MRRRPRRKQNPPPGMELGEMRATAGGNSVKVFRRLQCIGWPQVCVNLFSMLRRVPMWFRPSPRCWPPVTLSAQFCILRIPIALYGSGAWTWSRTLYNELYRWENALLRRIAKIRWRPDDDFVSFVERSTRKARELFHSNGGLSLSMLCTMKLITFL